MTRPIRSRWYEHLHDRRSSAAAVFATHYHELTDCPRDARVRNQRGVLEKATRFVSLHARPEARQSYGIHVAALAACHRPSSLGHARCLRSWSASAARAAEQQLA